MKKWLFSSIDNSSLIIFRIIFGLLVTLECWGAIITGWVNKVLIKPQFTFNFIGLDFLQPLPGNGMYAYFFVMGLLGVFVMLGYRYRISIISFSALWAGVYLMQKSSYNNHYYLLFLLNILMCMLPANKDLSLDVRLKHIKRSQLMPNWCRFLIISQLFIVYTYASLAKLYPDWLNTTVAANLMAGKKSFFLVGEVLQQKWAHYIITYTGICFDLLIIPALLYKPTRKWAFIISVFFHLYNSFILHIGIFPYLALGFSVFFFEGAQIRKWFYPKGEEISTSKKEISPSSNWILLFLSIWFVIQLILPARHHFIEGDVLWTEEGHRLSWRMMLRSKSGSNSFFIVDKKTNKRTRIKLKDYLTSKQRRSMSGKPDMLWQFAQHLKQEYQKDGKEIEVYVNNWTRVNKSKRRQLISPKTDLAATEWNYWGHNDWILIDSKEK